MLTTAQNQAIKKATDEFVDDLTSDEPADARDWKAFFEAIAALIAKIVPLFIT